MRYYLTILFFFTVFISKAQQDSTKRIEKVTVRTTNVKHRLDTNDVVYDLNNKPLRYYQYTKLINSGEYTYHLSGPPGDPNTKKILKKLSPEEQFRNYEIIKARNNIPEELAEGKLIDFGPLNNFYNLESLNNKVVLLIFWTAGCPPCTEAFSDVNEILQQLNNPKDLLVIAITPDQKEKALEKLKEKPLKYSDLMTGAGSVWSKYNIKTLPFYVVVDKTGIIRYSTSGSSSSTIPMLKNTLRATLNQ